MTRDKHSLLDPTLEAYQQDPLSSFRRWSIVLFFPEQLAGKQSYTKGGCDHPNSSARET